MVDNLGGGGGGGGRIGDPVNVDGRFMLFQEYKSKIFSNCNNNKN